MSAFLLLDAGQSGIKLESWTNGSQVSSKRLDPVYTNTPLAPQLVEAITEYSAEPSRFDEVIISSSGVTDPQALATEIRGELSGSSQITVVHDSIGSLVTNCGIEPAVVCAAGTGIVTLAHSKTDLARVDGWGHSMGDFGSGFWIGKAGFEAAMRAFDGRGPSTSLLRHLEQKFGDPSTAYIQLQGSRYWVAETAGFAKIVIENAEKDEISKEIVLSAATEISLSVYTAAEKVGLSKAEGVRVALVGMIFSAPVMREATESQIIRRLSAPRFLPPETNLFGLTELNQVTSGPLKNSIGRA